MSNLGPDVIGLNLSAATYEYMKRSLDLGLLFGTPGSMTLNPKVKELVEAIHHVLAGGTVETKILLPGHPDVVQELNGKLDHSYQQANQINQQAGHHVIWYP